MLFCAKVEIVEIRSENNDFYGKIVMVSYIMQFRCSSSN